MKVEILISVIMPIYNVESYLVRSIESVYNQTFEQWELILVNDGSTDASGDLIDEYSKKDSRIKVIHQENVGSGVARQRGLEIAKGDYICFVDPDDYLFKDALLNNYQLTQEYKVDLVINGFMEEVTNENNETKKNMFLPQLEGFFQKEKFREKFFKYDKNLSRALWNKLYSHTYIKENNYRFSDQRIGQDALFNYQIYENINSVYISNDAYYNYGVSREGSAIKGYKEERAIYEYNIAESFEKLILNWELEDLYKNEIIKEYWDVVYTELKNLNFPDCPYNKTEKIRELENVIIHPKVGRAINKMDYTELNHFRKILLFFVKKKKIGIALKIMSCRMKFSPN